MQIRLPRKPEPRDPRARSVVEWAEVIYYVFVLIFSAVILVLAAVHAPDLVTLLR